jgi:hypothetical protein
MIVGDPKVFAIESDITQVYPNLSQIALGYFIIHMAGKAYGVRAPDASMLAVSYDAVERRLKHRGQHCAAFSLGFDALTIALCYRTAYYEIGPEQQDFCGETGDAFIETLSSNGIVWAPDGDEAFDDGSHVLQFDHGDKVRLIGFMNLDASEDVPGTLAEIWLNARTFYNVLKRWQRLFHAEWSHAIERGMTFH